MENNNREKYSGPERRRYKRLNIYHLGIPVQIKYNNEDILIPGILLDISAGGIGILTFKKIEPGTTVNFSISLHNFLITDVKAKVIWVKEYKNTYRMGLEFTKISNKDRQQIANYVEEHLEEDM